MALLLRKKLLQHCKKSTMLVVRLKTLEPSNFLFASGLHKRNIRLKIASQSFKNAIDIKIYH